MVKALYDGRLAVDIAGLKMATPVTTGSGTFGFGLEFTDFLDLEKVGAVTVKGTSLEPAAGNKGQRAVETPSGMLNCIGLENPGSEYFLQHTLPELRQYDVPVIVNIYGHTPEEYGAVAKKLDVDGVDAVEINISCPNVKEGGIVFGTVPEAAAEVVRAVKANTSKMVIAKLSPNVTDIVVMAKAVEAAGADAISMINTLLGTKIDIERQRPVLGNVTGGLSGPAVRPVAVRLVYQVAQAVHIPSSAWAASCAPRTLSSSCSQVPALLLSAQQTLCSRILLKPSRMVCWHISTDMARRTSAKLLAWLCLMAKRVCRCITTLYNTPSASERLLGVRVCTPSSPFFASDAFSSVF